MLSLRLLSSQRPILRCLTAVPRHEGASKTRFSSDQTRNDEDSQNTKFVVGAGAIAAVCGLGYMYYRRTDDDSKPRSVPLKKPSLSAVRHDPPPQPYKFLALRSKQDTIPEYVPYVIVGAGTAAFTAAKSIRAADPKAKILMLTEEDKYPYMRPPLSKELWLQSDSLSNKLVFAHGKNKEKSIFFEVEDFYVKPEQLNMSDRGGIAVAQKVRVEKITPHKNKVLLSTGQEIRYDKCLVATGGSPRNLPVFENTSDKNIKDRVMVYRNVEDFKYLAKHAKEGAKIAVVGAGFLGCELAYALAHRPDTKPSQVSLVCPEGGILGRVLPDYLSNETTTTLQKGGVDVITKAQVDNVSLNKNQSVKLHLSNDKTVDADLVVVAVGLQPNTDLAPVSGLEVDNVLGGYLVNAELMARANVWVAGDAACFYDIKLGRRRVEHHDHAVVSGRLAGDNMAASMMRSGGGRPYWHQSMFWSEIGPDISFEAIGIIDSSLKTRGFFAKPGETPQSLPLAAADKKAEKQPKSTTDDGSVGEVPSEGSKFDKGVIFYLKDDDTVVGVVCWNIFGRMKISREILKSQDPVKDLSQLAKLYDITKD